MVVIQDVDIVSNFSDGLDMVGAAGWWHCWFVPEHEWLEVVGEFREGLVGGSCCIPFFTSSMEWFTIEFFELEVGFVSDVLIRNVAAEIRGFELAFDECAEVRDWEGIRGWAVGDGFECSSEGLVLFSLQCWCDVGFFELIDGDAGC